MLSYVLAIGPQSRVLPNVWLGVSVEDQATADERIPLLLQTPAAVQWVSYEPALGPLDLFTRCGPHGVSALEEARVLPDMRLVSPGLNWVVVGGESGRDARPPHPDWFRSVRDQCQAAGTAFFFKQWGEWCEHPEPPMRGHNNGAGLYVLPSGRLGCQGDYWNGMAAGMDKVGKKAAGELLDGREWKEWPREPTHEKEAVMARQPFGGMQLSFKGHTETMEEVFGSHDLAPAEMTARLWRYLKDHGMVVPRDPAVATPSA